MPLYDFQCQECKAYFEVQCKIAERTQKKECPACGSLNTGQAFISAPQVNADPIGRNQHGRAFKEVLNKIHSKTAGSVMNKTTDM